MKKDIKLAICPIGKFVFSHEDALIQKNMIYRRLDSWNIDHITIEKILPDGIVRGQEDVKKVVDYFNDSKIDALFIPHCNFGTEGAAAMIARELKVPTLLWGPRDGAPLEDGSRLRDSLCGTIATSKVLIKLKVPFSYIENCDINKEVFKTGIINFLKTASVVKSIKNMRIAQIGVRIDFFWTTIINEAELLGKFGIEILPVDMYDFISKIMARYSKEKKKYIKEIKEIKKWLKIEGLKDDEPLLKSLAFRDELLKLAENNELDAICIKSFSSLQEAIGGATGLADSMVCDEGIPIIGESDIHGAISSVILESASNNDLPSFFPDITIRHPKNDNAILLWHGSAPLKLKDPESSILMAPPWIIENLPPGSLSFKLREGPLTIARFDGDYGEYRLGIGQGRTVKGPYTKEFYCWMEVDNWISWEKKIIYGPYIHHCSAVFDHCGNVLEEVCKYIPSLKAERFDNQPISSER
jgi:L-fucose isomerase-like protein